MSDEYIFMWCQKPLLPSNHGTAVALKGGAEALDVFATAHILQYYDGKLLSTYIMKKDINDWKANKSIKFLDPSFYKKYSEKYEQESKKWWEWIREVEKKDYSNLTKKELIEDHELFSRFMVNSISFFGSTRPEFTYAVEQKLEEHLKKYFRDDWGDAFTVLATSSEEDEVQKEQKDWKILVESNPSDESLLNHTSKYPWLVLGTFSEEEALKHLKELMKNNEEEAVKKEDIVQKKKEILDKMEEDVKYLSTFLQEQSVRRMHIKAYWAGCYYLARNLLNAIAKEIGLEVSELIEFLLPPEVDEILKGEKTIDDIPLEKRKEKYITYFNPGEEIEITEGEEAEVLFKQKIKPPEKKLEIKGQTASVGKCTGKVRIVMPGDTKMLMNDIKEFQKGDVMVTSMTQPNMIPIVKKAAGIVADEGGITSHAAIIAREFGIPCIVGCLEAAQIFNNGDIIEVDADNGAVRKINE
ncbi:PEP-utilizing enzyme [Nanoarchaeota archaeon]